MRNVILYLAILINDIEDLESGGTDRRAKDLGVNEMQSRQVRLHRLHDQFILFNVAPLIDRCGPTHDKDRLPSRVTLFSSPRPPSSTSSSNPHHPRFSRIPSSSRPLLRRCEARPVIQILHLRLRHFVPTSIISRKT